MKNTQHQVFQYSIAILSIVLLLTNLGCSAHIEDAAPAFPAAPPPPAEKPFKDPAIQGPIVTGKWISTCSEDNVSGGSRQASLQFEADKFTYSNYFSSGKSCAQVTKTDSFSGIYQFSKQISDSLWIIDYHYKIGNVTYNMSGQKLQISDQKIYISEFTFGEVTVNKNLPFSKVGPTSPSPAEPSPTPQPPSSSVPGQELKDAVIAESYSRAKYAFCSTQGFGTLIDFGGANLSLNGSGQAKMGFKACNLETSVRWGSTPVNFKVQIQNGQPQISFLNTKYGDNIKPYSYQSALRSGQAANATIGGNSGECFFLENDGTKNIPFIYECY